MHEKTPAHISATYAITKFHQYFLNRIPIEFDQNFVIPRLISRRIRKSILTTKNHQRKFFAVLFVSPRPSGTFLKLRPYKHFQITMVSHAYGSSYLINLYQISHKQFKNRPFILTSRHGLKLRYRLGRSTQTIPLNFLGPRTKKKVCLFFQFVLF